MDNEYDILIDKNKFCNDISIGDSFEKIAETLRLKSQANYYYNEDESRDLNNS